MRRECIYIIAITSAYGTVHFLTLSTTFMYWGHPVSEVLRYCIVFVVFFAKYSYSVFENDKLVFR